MTKLILCPEYGATYGSDHGSTNIPPALLEIEVPRDNGTTYISAFVPPALLEIEVRRDNVTNYISACDYDEDPPC
jgi:hypothetical protein